VYWLTMTPVMWLFLLYAYPGESLGYIIVALMVAALAASTAGRRHAWTVGAGVMAAALTITLTGGHPPIPLPVFGAAAFYAFSETSQPLDWWLYSVLLPLVVQTGIVVLCVSWIRRRRLGVAPTPAAQL
jgi:hypothetical protein